MPLLCRVGLNACPGEVNLNSYKAFSHSKHCPLRCVYERVRGGRNRKEGKPRSSVVLPRIDDRTGCSPPSRPPHPEVGSGKRAAPRPLGGAARRAREPGSPAETREAESVVVLRHYGLGGSVQRSCVVVTALRFCSAWHRRGLRLEHATQTCGCPTATFNTLLPASFLRFEACTPRTDATTSLPVCPPCLSRDRARALWSAGETR